MPNQDPHIILDKELRRDIDAIIQRLAAASSRVFDPLQTTFNETAGTYTLNVRPSRERSLAITKLQEAVMWLGMDLKAINEAHPGAAENPYPNSKDPSNTKIDSTADGLTFGSKPSHQLRVIAEKAELDGKIEKLSAFTLTDIFAKLPPEEQDRLSVQLVVMKDYSRILSERIMAF